MGKKKNKKKKEAIPPFEWEDLGHRMKRIEADALVLLEFIYRNPDEKQTWENLSEKTGIPITTLRKMLNPEYWVKRPYEYLLKHRIYNREFYYYLISRSKFVNGEWWLNESLWGEFIMIAQHYGYIVQYVGKRGLKIIVQKRRPFRDRKL